MCNVCLICFFGFIQVVSFSLSLCQISRHWGWKPAEGTVWTALVAMLRKCACDLKCWAQLNDAHSAGADTAHSLLNWLMSRHAQEEINVLLSYIILHVRSDHSRVVIIRTLTVVYYCLTYSTWSSLAIITAPGELNTQEIQDKQNNQINDHQHFFQDIMMMSIYKHFLSVNSLSAIEIMLLYLIYSIIK